MLALIENQLVHVEPALPPEQYHLVLGQDRVRLYADGQPVEAGVTYFRVKEKGLKVDLDPRSGELTTRGRGSATLRAIFASQALDMEIER